MTLSPRQTEVADLICEGLMHKEIADLLHITRQTVEKNLMIVYVKTDTHSAAQLFWWMLRNKAGKTYLKAKALML